MYAGGHTLHTVNASHPPIAIRARPCYRLMMSVTTALLALTAGLAAQPARGFLDKPAGAIRVMTWNVYRDSVFPPDGAKVDVSAANRPAQFARVLQAVRPDIICLQEVTASAARSAALVGEILPLPNGTTWQAHAAVDTVIVSRFGLDGRAEGRVEGDARQRGHAIALIKTPVTDLYVICAHFQSSDTSADIALREQQARIIASTIREARAGDGAVPLRPRTPFIVLGDFNAIAGATAFVDDLVAGRTGRSTSAEGPDWDRSPLTDAQPSHNATGSDRHTWRNDREPFPPGMLDRIVYSDSVLTSLNQFVLDTTTMSNSQLAAARLRAVDVMRDPQAGIHDHFPLVIDVGVRGR